MQTASVEHRNSGCMIIKHVQNGLEVLKRKQWCMHTMHKLSVYVELLDDLQCNAFHLINKNYDFNKTDVNCSI